MKWAILVPTMKERALLWSDLEDRLTELVRGNRDVKIISRITDRTTDVAMARNQLLADAKRADATYVSFIDDDDLVAEEYVSAIAPHLGTVDTVQFQLAFYEDGYLKFIEKRSLRYHGVFTDQRMRYRDISHLSVTRRDLVLPFRSGADPLGRPAEDTRWADDMRAANRLKTEHVVERALYHYFFRTNKEEFCQIC